MLISPIVLTVVTIVLCYVIDKWVGGDAVIRKALQYFLMVVVITIWVTYFTTACVDIIGMNLGWWDNIVTI